MCFKESLILSFILTIFINFIDRETSKSMHLASQMNRFTHETKNIKSMIATFKSEMIGKELMKRSKSGMNLNQNQSMENNEMMKYNQKDISMRTGKNINIITVIVVVYQ